MGNADPKPGTILMLGEIVHCHEEFNKLASDFDVIQVIEGNREGFIQDCKKGKYDHVTAISRNVPSVKITGRFDRELITQLPASIKFICHNGAGYDQIDVKAARERGITVSNTPGSLNDSTADIAIFLLIGAMRRAWIAQKSIRAGEWYGKTPFGRDPSGRVVGILGLGGIGSAFAQRAQACGFKIQYHNRTARADSPYKYVSFEDLVRTSDVLSIHIQYSAEAYHLIGREQFSMMKKDIIIINTARGAVIDEEAMVEALKADRIWSVGLDVYENEPTPHAELLDDDRVMLLPHIGSATIETRRNMELQAMDNARSAIEHKKLVTPVN